jgi:hypothetical protein
MTTVLLPCLDLTVEVFRGTRGHKLGSVTIPDTMTLGELRASLVKVWRITVCLVAVSHVRPSYYKARLAQIDKFLVFPGPTVSTAHRHADVWTS